MRAAGAETEAGNRAETVAATEEAGRAAAYAGAPVDAPELSDEARRHLRRNLTLTVGEIVFFSLGMAFFDSGTVIPGFITALTGSTVLLGLAPTLFQLGLGLPQLAAAGFLAHRPRKKPFLIAVSLLRNSSFFLLAALAWFGVAPGLLLPGFFLCYFTFAFGMGLESVAWMDIFAKICAARLRGRVIAIGRTIANLVSLGAGFLVSRLLLEAGFPRNFATLFFAAGVCMTLALITFASVREPIEAVPARDPRPSERAVLARGRTIWRADANFRRYTLARFAYAVNFVALPFYFRFAHDVVGLGDVAIGQFVSASMAGQIGGNFLWGYIGDRFGKKLVVQSSLVLALLLPGYVLLTPSLPHNAFLLVYVASGLVLAGDMIGWMTLLLAIVPAGQRPFYISLQSTLLVPANLLPLFGGVVLSLVPYTVFFGTIALAFAASLWLVSRVREAPASLAA